MQHRLPNIYARGQLPLECKFQQFSMLSSGLIDYLVSLSVFSSFPRTTKMMEKLPKIIGKGFQLISVQFLMFLKFVFSYSLAKFIVSVVIRPLNLSTRKMATASFKIYTYVYLFKKKNTSKQTRIGEHKTHEWCRNIWPIDDRSGQINTHMNQIT